MADNLNLSVICYIIVTENINLSLTLNKISKKGLTSLLGNNIMRMPSKLGKEVSYGKGRNIKEKQRRK